MFVHNKKTQLVYLRLRVPKNTNNCNLPTVINVANTNNSKFFVIKDSFSITTELSVIEFESANLTN